MATSATSSSIGEWQNGGANALRLALDRQLEDGGRVGRPIAEELRHAVVGPLPGPFGEEPHAQPERRAPAGLVGKQLVELRDRPVDPRLEGVDQRPPLEAIGGELDRTGTVPDDAILERLLPTGEIGLEVDPPARAGEVVAEDESPLDIERFRPPIPEALPVILAPLADAARLDEVALGLRVVDVAHGVAEIGLLDRRR